MSPLDILTRTPLATLAKSMSLANKANGALLVVTGLVGLFTALTNAKLLMFENALLSVYVGGFGALLLYYEFSAGTDLRQNYGFMYTYLGRAAFLLLVANLSWTCAPLGLLCAVATNANGIASAYVMYAHPSFISGAANPTAIGGFDGEAGDNLVYAGSCSSSSFDPASDAARSRAASGATPAWTG